MNHISKISKKLGIDNKEIIYIGNYKAKIPFELIKEKPGNGKLIVVTGITPTKAGEGKTTTAIGLTQGLNKLGKSAVTSLREPSLGPVFGIKGGGTGGGKSKVIPEDEINIHFTGDAHAIGSAHNLLASLVDNAIQRNQNLSHILVFVNCHIQQQYLIICFLNHLNFLKVPLWPLFLML